MKKLHVVTGANRGIGYELARILAHRGDRVIATARHPEQADDLNELAVRVEQLDVTDASSVASFVERLEGMPVDVLINNAGQGTSHGSFENVDWSEVAQLFAVNSIGPLRLTQTMLPNLRAGTGKVVFNVTSKMGSIADNGSGDAYGYRASKSALNMMTKSLSIDLRDEGFTCVLLHPGWVRTDMGGSAAPVEPADSARGLLELLDRLQPERDNGRFYDFEGEEIPW